MAAPVPVQHDLKLAGVFAAAAALATAALFPYLLVVMPQLLANLPAWQAQVLAQMPAWLAQMLAQMPAWAPLLALVLAQMLQAGLFLGLMAFVGLRMGHRVGLGAPWLDAWLAGTPRPRFDWRTAVVLGLLAGAVIVVLDPLFSPHMPDALTAIPAPGGKASAAVGFLASFYGGIAEELQMRLFLMTLVAWLLSFIKRGRYTAWKMWFALLVAAVLFGAGHLPAAAKIWPLDGVVIARTLLLNGIGGVAFGWLYWKRGLEAAMLAHFGTDLVLHVIAPLAFG